jgi:hypothetical protein
MKDDPKRWLEDIAKIVNILYKKAGSKKRFCNNISHWTSNRREMQLKTGEYYTPIHVITKDKSVPQGTKLTMPEIYALFSAIHDKCLGDRGEIEINPWQDEKYLSSKLGATEGTKFWSLIGDVEKLTLNEEPALKVFLEKLKADLKGIGTTPTSDKIPKRGRGVLNKQVEKLLKSSKASISATEIADILNNNYNGTYKPTSASSVSKTKSWSHRPKKK